MDRFYALDIGRVLRPLLNWWGEYNVGYVSMPAVSGGVL
jgi:hypothetical protein